MARTNLFVLTMLIGLCPTAAFAQTREVATVEAATRVLDEIMAIRLRGIPSTLLADAQGIVIVPRVIKGGFVVGVRRGHGIALTRDEGGGWQGPVFVTLTGGSVGWQLGVQSTDVILVFKTKTSIDNLMHGKLTLGADAAAAAGPVGRKAAAATDGRLEAEIYSYSRSRGLFAGVSLDGSILKVDDLATNAFHGLALKGHGDASQPHDSIADLLSRIAHYSEGHVTGKAAVEVEQLPLVPPVVPEDRLSQASRELAVAARRLDSLLNSNWQRYLALPVEVFEADDHPSTVPLHASITRFEAIAQDSRYRVLSDRAEFQAVHQMLKQYHEALSETANLTLDGLPLPPPPVVR